MGTTIAAKQKQIPFKISDKLHKDMRNKTNDRAIYFMLLDSIDAGEVIYCTGQNVFRPKEKRPEVDKIISDNDVIVRMLYNQI